MNVHDVFVVDSAGVTTIELREQLPWVRLWDENWNLVRVVQAGWRIDQPEIVVLPWSDPVARMLQESCIRGLMWLTVDDGERWLGRLDQVKLVRSPNGRRTWISASFVDDRVRRRMIEELAQWKMSQPSLVR
ncbi:UNVERIFIED_ORG: hypothetical protein M2328_005773 [Rhodococcus erythropolis]